MDDRPKIPWSPPFLGKEEEEAVVNVVRSGWMSQGAQTACFEGEISGLCGAKHCIVVNSGTSALIASLLAAGVGAGDDVLVPAMTFVATVNAVLAVGANPILTDCDSRTFNVTPSLLEERITPGTKAVIFVDVYGMPCDRDAILSFARKHHLITIEDAAEAIGAGYRGSPAGSGPDFTVFSFHMAKLVSAIEGGCVLTDCDAFAENLRRIRNHGMRERWNHVSVGFNFRITDIQSAIGRVQLKRLSQTVKHRGELVAFYKESLGTLGEFQEIPDYVTAHPHMIFALLLPERRIRDDVAAYLGENGVDTRICWVPMHQLPCHKKRFEGQGPFLNAEMMAKRNLSLPLGNGLTEGQAHRVASLVKRAMGG